MITYDLHEASIAGGAELRKWTEGDLPPTSPEDMAERVYRVMSEILAPPIAPAYDDDACQRCGGEGFIFECFDGFCEDADVGCDDCTQPCPECQGGTGNG